MRILGLDIGSRSVDAVWLEGGRIVDSAVVDSGFEPQRVARGFVESNRQDIIVATGYGRHAAGDAFDCRVITEIKAYGLGVHTLFPTAMSVLDIGGQDTKVISLDENGRISDFEMNDKCAAGTGKFLEVMARALGFDTDLEEMATQASATLGNGIKISSMCTVFAESEVTGLVHRGEDCGDIARGIHEAIAKRTLSSLKRIRATGPLVFAGGVANSSIMVELIRAGFDGEVFIPDKAQIVGAYGAALSASES